MTNQSAVPSIYDLYGRRKYVTPTERLDFIKAAQLAPTPIKTFCLTLAFTGARISELLALTPAGIDLGAQMIVFESLKKRTRGVFRAVPIPADLMAILSDAYQLTGGFSAAVENKRLWPWSRTTAWTRVKEVMATAGVPQIVQKPKALRHGFGIASIRSGIPLNMVQRWLGHSQLATTAIYTNAIGEEELDLAARLWNFSPLMER